MKRFTLFCLGLVATYNVVFAGEIVDIQWERGPNLPEFRKGGCATAMNGKVISVFGMRQPWTHAFIKSVTSSLLVAHPLSKISLLNCGNGMR